MKIKVKGQMTPLVSTFIMIMIVTIIGVSVVIPVIQDQITAGQKTGTAAQNLITTSGTTTLSNPDLISGTFAAVNATNGASVSSALYTLNLPAGTVAWGSTAAYPTVNVTYGYYASGYIKNQVVITLLSLVPLFLVLIILIGVIALVKF